MAAPRGSDESRSWRRAVVSTYNDEAAEYSSHRRMQDHNLLRLLEVVGDAAGDHFSPGQVLDLGCGDGQMSDLLLHGVWARDPRIFGIDPAFELLRYGRSLGTHLSTACGDARALPFSPESFDLVLSNSVLHWLNAPELGLSAVDAITEVERVLCPGGLFGASVAARPSTDAFDAVYTRALDEARASGALTGEVVRRDPVGAMVLEDIVEELLTVGFDVIHASAEYEPVNYASTDEYLDDVRSYGFSAYTAAFSESDRRNAFAGMRRRFIEAHGDGPYLHKQYMIYFVARASASAITRS